MPDDPLKNPDRDHEHRRRREAGSDNDSPDGKAVAEALYGGNPSALTEDDTGGEPTLFDEQSSTMAHPNVDRSKRHEREIVHAAEDSGLTAVRAWNSNGKSLGETKECDVRLETESGQTWTVQAKRRKTVASYLTCEDADVVITREDRGENLVVVPLEGFLDLLTGE